MEDGVHFRNGENMNKSPYEHEDNVIDWAMDTLPALFPPVELDAETRQRILDKVKVYKPLVKGVTMTREQQLEKALENLLALLTDEQLVKTCTDEDTTDEEQSVYIYVTTCLFNSKPAKEAYKLLQA